ncbi:MAG: MarR family transcriptional regulator [Acidobacteriaceae bacterium]|jgi:DNA-binding MarR family transcriptional regulator
MKSIPGRPNPEKLAEQLHASAIHLLRQLRRTDEASGTTASQLSALSVIVFSGPISLGKLAEIEQVRPPTMTRLINALESDQLILKTRSEHDARIVHLSATNKGRRLLLAARMRRVRVLADQIKKMSELDQENLASALSTIRKLIDSLRSP